MSIINLWKKRGQIIEGIKNSVFTREDVEQVARQRNEICKTNQCGFYDPEGKSDKCYVKGSACCSACGCKLTFKQRSLSSSCGLSDLNMTPLWDAILDEHEEEKLKEKLGITDEN